MIALESYNPLLANAGQEGKRLKNRFTFARFAVEVLNLTAVRSVVLPHFQFREEAGKLLIAQSGSCPRYIPVPAVALSPRCLTSPLPGWIAHLPDRFKASRRTATQHPARAFLGGAPLKASAALDFGGRLDAVMAPSFQGRSYGQSGAGKRTILNRLGQRRRQRFRTTQGP